MLFKIREMVSEETLKLSIKVLNNIQMYTYLL